METAHAFLPLLRECIIRSFTNQQIADALNQQEFRTVGVGVPWTKDTVSQFRSRHRDMVEDAENERLRREWAAVPMPEFPIKQDLADEDFYVGTPFFDTGIDGELHIPVPAMRRTR